MVIYFAVVGHGGDVLAKVSADRHSARFRDSKRPKHALRGFNVDNTVEVNFGGTSSAQAVMMCATLNACSVSTALTD